MTDLRKAAEAALKFCEMLGENHWGDRKAVIYSLRAALAEPDEKEKFCDRNCVWTDHHPGCALAQPELKTVSPEQDLQLVSNLLKEYGLSVLETLAAFKAQTEQEPFGWLYESKTGNRIFHLVSDDKRAFHADFEAAQQYPEGHKMTPLYTAPPPAESKLFSPDWDRVQALEESLREHMAEIHRLRDVMHSIVKADANDELGIEENLLAAVKGALVQPKQTAMPPDIAKVLFENVESLYVEESKPPTKWTPMSEYASKSAAVPGRAEVLDQIKKAWNELQEKAVPEKDEPVAWGCFRDGVLLDDLVSDEASVDYWCESDEPEMQKLVKRALYTHPPQRKPLTDAEINEIAEDGMNGYDRFTFTSAIERAHGIRGEHEAN